MRQNPGERNFHIFYCLLAGLDAEVQKKWNLFEAKQYHYLKQSGCVSDPTIDDAGDYKRVVVSVRIVG